MRASSRNTVTHSWRDTVQGITRTLKYLWKPPYLKLTYVALTVVTLAACNQQSLPEPTSTRLTSSTALPSCTADRMIHRDFFGPSPLYFDSHSAELTARTLQMLGRLTDARRNGNQFDLIVEGNTDTNETTSADHTLSVRRAEAVKNYLVQQKLDGRLIKASGNGATRLLVPTPPNTPEPQNRPVDIVIEDITGPDSRVDNDRRECADWISESCIGKQPGQVHPSCKQAMSRMRNNYFP